jgi:hypothetical protein
LENTSFLINNKLDVVTVRSHFTNEVSEVAKMVRFRNPTGTKMKSQTSSKWKRGIKTDLEKVRISMDGS